MDKILFLLIELGIAYILSPNIQPILPSFDEDFEGLKVEKKRHEENDCRGFIINSLFDRYDDLYIRNVMVHDQWTW